MENRDLLKLAFEAGKEYGSNRTDKNFNDFLDKHKEQFAISGVSICLERAKKYARHQHFLGTQGKELVEFDDWKAKD